MSLPEAVRKVKTSDKLAIIRKVPLASMLNKGLGSDSFPDSQGRASVINAVMLALDEVGYLDKLDAELLTSKMLSDCDDDVVKDISDVLEFLRKWYPFHDEYLSKAKEDDFHRGALTGLWACHVWIQSQFEDSTLPTYKENPFESTRESPIPEHEVPEEAPVPDVSSPVAPSGELGLIKILAELSEIEEISFKLDVIDGKAAWRVICPQGVTIDTLLKIQAILKDCRLNAENSVISLTAPITL